MESGAHWTGCVGLSKTNKKKEGKVKRKILVGAALTVFAASFTLQAQAPRVFDLSDFSHIPGAKATINRMADSICFEVSTHSLPEGAYSVWVQGFDNPDACEFGGKSMSPPAQQPPLPGSCGMGDIPDPATQAFNQWASAFLVGPNGHGMVDFCAEVGAEPPGFVLSGDGLENPNAELHLILRGHGRALYENATELGLQLTVPSGGCAITGACGNFQVAIFP